MNENTQIRLVAMFSMAIAALFGVVAGQAVYSLFGLAAPIVVAVVMLFIIWRIWEEAEQIIKYRDELYWEGVEIVNKELLSQDPRNVTDARELINVLKERVRDLNDARNEAVDAYNKMKAEQNKETE